MKRMLLAVVAVAGFSLIGCGGKDSGSSTSTGGTTAAAATGTTGQTTGQTTSTGTSSTGSTTGSTTASSTTASSTTASSTTTGTTGTTGVTTAGTSSTGGFQVASHAAYPQVPNNSGTPTLGALQLSTITFNGYDHQSDAEAFGDWVVGSSWLTTVGADYQVGAGTHIAKVHLTDTAPTSISDNQIQAYLKGKLDDGTLLAPGATIPGTSTTVTEPLYAIFYPSSTTISLGQGGGTSCQDFGGYHSYFTYTPAGGTAVNVSYAVLPTCTQTPPGMSVKDYLTVAASHEYMEAATDPFPTTGFGTDTSSYAIEDYSSAWSFVPGEVGDLCIGSMMHDSSGFMVQRIWSNSAAARSETTGESPCIPSPSYAFFGVSVDHNNIVSTKAGQTVTYNLSAFTQRAVSQRFMVMVYPVQASFNATWKLTTSDGQTLTQSSGFNGSVNMNNGDTATLVINVPSGASSQDYAMFQVMAFANGTSDYSFWPLGLFVTAL
ncbi:MAG: hypothetical protein JST54_24035 [Deltaproteobacteria bacterium]|nr:hypothetical protein [Deltaproteobacteria bacterium]